jgi:hypothetical protein
MAINAKINNNNIIGICGLINSGKGTVADILEKNYGFIKLSFADSLKDCVSAVFGWSRDLLEGNTVESRIWREKEDLWWSNRLEIPKLTPRWILQHWGTDVCRIGFHKDIWIASMECKLIKLIESTPNMKIVIPDTRFQNEIEIIKNMNGQVWRIKRGNDPKWLIEYVQDGRGPVDIHPSEWDWANSNFDHVIENNSTLNDLMHSITKLL